MGGPLWELANLHALALGLRGLLATPLPLLRRQAGVWVCRWVGGWVYAAPWANFVALPLGLRGLLAAPLALLHKRCVDGCVCWAFANYQTHPLGLRGLLAAAFALLHKRACGWVGGCRGLCALCSGSLLILALPPLGCGPPCRPRRPPAQESVHVCGSREGGRWLWLACRLAWRTRSCMGVIVLGVLSFDFRGDTSVRRTQGSSPPSRRVTNGSSNQSTTQPGAQQQHKLLNTLCSTQNPAEPGRSITW